MLEPVLRFLGDYWPWLATAYLACGTYALALCRAAKLADEAWERSGLPHRYADLGAADTRSWSRRQLH